jgi:hypothetical protein
MSIESGWPSIAFRLDAADAPAEDAEAVDHRGVRVRADEGVGKAQVSPDVFPFRGPARP